MVNGGFFKKSEQLDFADCEVGARDPEPPEGLVFEYVQIGATWGPTLPL